MDFVFFGADNVPLYTRNDAEQAEWTVHEMALRLLFPYDAVKVAERGQRVGFYDTNGVFQPFEIRRVKTYEPDHYQEIEAEHIAISELTDEFFEGQDFDGVTASSALTTLLTGTLWSVGTNTASGTSSVHLGMSDKWSDVREIETNWNVRITPRCTFASTGITQRYLDIAPADGTFKGVRLSLEKNADEVGVNWDDSNVKTALYGFGASEEVTENNQTVRKPITFADVVWTATSSHPAKPSGQTYLEDPTATADYGRNGRARFGYYQNADISDKNVLLQKTWECLKTMSVPDVSIECTVNDLKRYGYVDAAINLGDLAQVEIRPTGVVLTKQITCLTVDLLDPTQTRVTVGAYVPNIVYIAKKTNDSATGGGGGGGGGNQTNNEYEWREFKQWIGVEGNTIRLYAQRLNRLDEIMQQAGIDIDAQTGVIIYYDDNVNMIQSKLNVQSGQISLVVQGTGANAHVRADVIVSAINDSSVTIDADRIELNGLQTIINNYLSANNVDISYLEVINSLSVLGATELNTLNAGSISCDGDGDFSGLICDTLQVGSTSYSYQQQTVVTGVTVTKTGMKTWALDGGDTYTASLVEYVTYNSSTITYLGA